jgi:molybdate transport system regulatory protein
MPGRRPPPPLELGGSLWITAGGQSLGGHGRVGLLRAVAQHGSITQAARAFGMSYKAAWDAIDAMNTLSGRPLVERTTGGRGGGSTRLTEHGLRLVARYEQLDALHQRFVQHLARQAMDLDRELSLLEVLNVKTSARNQWLGTVRAIRTGAVNDEVEVALPGGEALGAVITHESTQALGLQVNTPVIVLVKAPAVLLATGLEGARLSAGNRLEGRVRQVQPGAVNAEVVLETAAGLQVVAIVTQRALDELGLRAGVPVTALVKASDVVLAVVT